MKISVLTPTYNRGDNLEKLYNSLLCQTFTDFQWIIVDDGSTDNTEDICENFIKSNPFFKIIYIKKTNGGKHTALNLGIKEINSLLTFIVDSDDWLPKDAIEIINAVENSIIDKKHFAGVCGIKCFENYKQIGTSFTEDYKDLTTIEFKKSGYKGDKAEVFYTDILKKYPFPVFENEKFLTEKIVWDKIANEGYKLRYFNKNIYFCEYLEGGLTKSGIKIFVDNPKQWALSIRRDYEYKLSDFYDFGLKIYLYYLYEKDNISLIEIAENFNLNIYILKTIISIFKNIDFLRKCIKNKSIYDTVNKYNGK